MTKHLPDHEVELFREGDQYVVVVDLPGHDRSGIDLRWHDGHLHVHAERPTDGGPTEVVNRQIGLPHEIDADGISATYEDGVLEVTMPILEERHTPGTRIEVD